MEVPSASIGNLASWSPYLEKPLPLDHQVQRIIRCVKASLCKNDLIGNGPRTESKLKPTGNNCLRTCCSARLHKILIQQILKLGFPHLKSSGVGIGKIVRNVVDIHLLRIHPTSCTEQCPNHF